MNISNDLRIVDEVKGCDVIDSVSYIYDKKRVCLLFFSNNNWSLLKKTLYLRRF